MFKCHVCKENEATLQCSQCERPVCPNCISESKCWSCYSEENQHNPEKQNVVSSIKYSDTLQTTHPQVSNPTHSKVNEIKKIVKTMLAMILFFWGVIAIIVFQRTFPVKGEAIDKIASVISLCFIGIAPLTGGFLLLRNILRKQ